MGALLALWFWSLPWALSFLPFLPSLGLTTSRTGSAFAISEGGRSKWLTRGESLVLGFEKTWYVSSAHALSASPRLLCL